MPYGLCQASSGAVSFKIYRLQPSSSVLTGVRFASSLQLVKNPRLRRDIGAAAIEEVHQKWLWSRIVEKIWAVYRELI
jgi:hypothetical protein